MSAADFILEPTEVVSPTSGAHPGWVVEVRQGVISYAGPRRGDGEDPALPRIPLKGALAPGFIDGHVHLLGGVTTGGQTDTVQMLTAVRNCRRALAAGLTTVADLGARSHGIFEIVEAAAGGVIDAPRIAASGQAVCMTGGHGHGTVSVEADGPVGVRTAVRRQLGAGARVVKLMATGGSGSRYEGSGAVQLDVDELAAGVQEAERASVPVTCHATSLAGITRALDAGIRVIQHGIGIDRDTARRMRDLDAVVVPTLSVYHRSSLQTLAATPLYMREKAARMREMHRESFLHVLEAGVEVAFGTDTGGEYHPLGDIAIEMELMQGLGMDAASILASLTVNNTRWLGIENETGDIREGLAADFVLLDGSPLSDWTALTRPRAVWCAGRLIANASPAIATGESRS